MDAQSLCEGLIAELDAQIARARAIAELPAERLLHRPDPAKWNVLDVFEHMVLSSGVYLQGLEHVFATRAADLPASLTFTPGLLGDYFTRAMLPKADGRLPLRMPTTRRFDPARNTGSDSGSILRFVAMCEGLIRLLNRAPATDLNRMRIVSTLGPLVQLRAGDAFRFPIAHQQRHFMQIERLLAHH